MVDSGQVVLKVGIYPGITDVDKGHFETFIKQKFEDFSKKRGKCIVLNVMAGWDAWDPYNIDKYETYLSEEVSSFDMLEIDTILLGEVIEKQLLQELDESKYKIKEQNLEVGANAVCYKGKYYGVPTLECANFLVELAAGDISPEKQVQVFRELLKQGKITFDQFKEVVEAKRSVFDDGAMIGNFRGSFTLPSFYLNAYINYHENAVVQKGMEPASLDDETEVLKQMQWYASLGMKENGENLCISSAKVYEKPSNVIKDMRTANHRMVHAYSETIGQILADEHCQKRGIKPYGVISPPLGTQDKLLTSTDALIVNKHHYQAKAEAIDLFIAFYTSLGVRNELAKGTKSNPQHYFMMSQKEFYTAADGIGAKDPLYISFYTALIGGGSKAISTPNSDFVHKRKDMDKKLVEKLEWS